MKRFFQIKTKFKVVCIFIVIIVLVLLNNVMERRSINKMDDSIAAIYKDRLLPATYLYGLSNHLYEERLTDPTGHDAAIDSLVSNYEKTYLTAEEERQWLLFKQYLGAYREAKATGDTLGTQHHFQLAMATLNTLTSIQIGEGASLQRASASLAQDSSLSAQLEMTLLIVLGVLAVVLLGLSDRHVFNPADHQSMN
ncbi:MCP four helix bundle domain-containing protein [Chitinophaga lutea]